MRTNIPSRWTSGLTFASAAVCIGFAFYSLCIGAFENWLALMSGAALLALIASKTTVEDELSPDGEEAAASSSGAPGYVAQRGAQIQGVVDAGS